MYDATQQMVLNVFFTIEVTLLLFQGVCVTVYVCGSMRLYMCRNRSSVALTVVTQNYTNPKLLIVPLGSQREDDLIFLVLHLETGVSCHCSLTFQQAAVWIHFLGNFPRSPVSLGRRAEETSSGIFLI